VEGEPSPNVPGTFEIFLTSLYPRKFPLLRYRIGDLISDNPNALDFDQTFSRVIGRCNDYIELADGVKIHSEAFTHAVKECDGVGQFQVLQSSDGKISFRYVSVTNDATIQPEICRRLALIHLELQGVEFEKVASLPKTISGKTRTIIRKNADE